MAAADKAITREEMRLLGRRALAWGITDDQFQDLLEEAIRGETPLNLPTDTHERTAILADMIRMMGADGHMDEREKRLFAMIAARTDLDGDKLHDVIDAAISDSDPET